MKKFPKSSYHNNDTIPLTKRTSTRYECNGENVPGCRVHQQNHIIVPDDRVHHKKKKINNVIVPDDIARKKLIVKSNVNTSQ